jgi:hypothetical protein
MEGFHGDSDLEAGVAAQGGINFFKNERGGIGGKFHGQRRVGTADFVGWKIAALCGDRQHARAGVVRSARNGDGDRSETAFGELNGSVAGARKVVGD